MKRQAKETGLQTCDDSPRIEGLRDYIRWLHGMQRFVARFGPPASRPASRARRTSSRRRPAR